MLKPDQADPLSIGGFEKNHLKKGSEKNHLKKKAAAGLENGTLFFVVVLGVLGVKVEIEFEYRSKIRMKNLEVAN